jgi:hypothetical protein
MKSKLVTVILCLAIGVLIGIAAAMIFPHKAKAESIVKLPPWTVSVGTGAYSPASLGNVGALKIANVQPYAWAQIGVPAYAKKASAVLRFEQGVKKNTLLDKFPPLQARLEIGYTF